MRFTIYVTTDSRRRDIKDRCCELLAEFLDREGYFSVEYDPDEIDRDKIVRAERNGAQRKARNTSWRC